MSHAEIGKRSTHHATFVIERKLNATPALVFSAWARPEAKARWFACSSEWDSLEFRMDFRVGGQEVNRGRPRAGGPVHAFDGRYQDIVPDQRIIYSYDMHLDDNRISVSLATVEFKPHGDGSLLVFTEQGVFLDGLHSSAQREEGTQSLLDSLEAEIRRSLS
jgi:uncharacterized protein YndB with AHSA1/START domain